MEKAGSPVTSCVMVRNGGKFWIRSGSGNVVKVSSKIRPWQREWQGSLFQRRGKV